jgi:hypothetical protein
MPLNGLAAWRELVKRQLVSQRSSLYVLTESTLPNDPVMADQIVITEKTSQALSDQEAVVRQLLFI